MLLKQSQKKLRMFYNLQNDKQQELYKNSLTTIGSLSKLFSDSKAPYLYYRIAEKIFCNSFKADDLSRGDVALDAVKDGLGIGLKTFLASNNKSFQKVAEFNKDKHLYEDKSLSKLVNVVANLRNKRIEFTQNLYDIDTNIYHCVVRYDNHFKIFEEKMDYIDCINISNVKKNRNSITFNDGLHDYSFNLSKSTLTKRFITNSYKDEFDVQILKNPLEDLQECLTINTLNYDDKLRNRATIYLPLYGSKKEVYPRSGLNQWNANGRERDVNEVYIPIPMKVHKKAPDFFPDRDQSFYLILPNKEKLLAKVCQSNSKALMSYSNKALGKWILRDILNLKEGELLTYERLEILGIDSVLIDKIDAQNYEINFVSLGSYEKYILGNE